MQYGFLWNRVLNLSRCTTSASWNSLSKSSTSSLSYPDPQPRTRAKSLPVPRGIIPTTGGTLHIYIYIKVYIKRPSTSRLSYYFEICFVNCCQYPSNRSISTTDYNTALYVSNKMAEIQSIFRTNLGQAHDLAIR